MLDVHAPQETTHTWKDFLIHMMAICLGLLIAIGLEQSVELIHHHLQRERVEAALRNESLLNRRIVAYDTDSVNQVRHNLRLNMTTLERDRNNFSPVPPPHDTFLPFINTAWTAARSDELVTLLPDDLAQGYWKVNVQTDAMAAAIASLADARKKVNSLLYLHGAPSQLTTDERTELLRAYSNEDQEIGNLNYILLNYGFMNEAALASHVPTIEEMADESRRAQTEEAQPAHP